MTNMQNWVRCPMIPGGDCAPGTNQCERKTKGQAMILRPCLHCPMKSICLSELLMRQTVKGLGVTVASLNCTCPYDLFPAGCSVELSLPVMSDAVDMDGAPIGNSHMLDFAGIVMRRKGRKIQIWLTGDWHELQTKAGVVCVYPDRLTRLDEPKMDICPECRKPAGETERRSYDGRQFACWKCDGFGSCEEALDAPLEAKP